MFGFKIQRYLKIFKRESGLCYIIRPKLVDDIKTVNIFMKSLSECFEYKYYMIFLCICAAYASWKIKTLPWKFSGDFVLKIPMNLLEVFKNSDSLLLRLNIVHCKILRY